MGLGHKENKSIPTIIEQLNNLEIKSIFVGGYHNFCLNGNLNCSFFILFELKNTIGNRNLYGWGRNGKGQLGIGNNSNQNLPQQYLENQKFIFISCGQNHTIGITGFFYFSFNK